VNCHTVNPPKSSSGEKEIAAPVSATLVTSGIQLFITHKMRKVLEGKLGFEPNEVDEMLPEVKKNKEMSKI